MDTDLQEAIVEKSDEAHVCSVHRPMVSVITGLSRRMRRVEAIGIATFAMAAGLVGKDLLLPLLFKILGGP